ncbi:MAG: hypothetical protein ACRC62_02835 [Microcoleus sp.]
MPKHTDNRPDRKLPLMLVGRSIASAIGNQFNTLLKKNCHIT